jgi:hypothetical protein
MRLPTEGHYNGALNQYGTCMLRHCGVVDCLSPDYVLQVCAILIGVACDDARSYTRRRSTRELEHSPAIGMFLRFNS